MVENIRLNSIQLNTVIQKNLICFFSSLFSLYLFKYLSVIFLLMKQISDLKKYLMGSFILLPIISNKIAF